jgi:PPK2 family polyphosphate:nucleotide phosphotransferase
VQLRDFSTVHNGEAKKEDAFAEMEKLRFRLNELQDLFYADGRFAMLIVLQAIDTGGKDGTVKSVFREVGPLGCNVVNFGVPTSEELSHDYLWRYHVKAPERGHVTIFNRSYYESVLVERVKGIAPEKVWKARYEEINRFEAYLASQGTMIMKFYLHISKEEQRQRLQERVDNPKKRWKFRAGDLDDRKRWGEYLDAFGDMVSKCNTETAPWHVVPADQNWFRDLVVARALVKKLESLDLKYPEAEAGVVGTVVV